MGQREAKKVRRAQGPNRASGRGGDIEELKKRNNEERGDEREEGEEGFLHHPTSPHTNPHMSSFNSFDREDLACLDGRMRRAIQSVESTLHKELTNQTWLIVKWVSGLLVTLLPSLMAATFYIARYMQ